MARVFIVGAKRTPMGIFGGVLSEVKATRLGSIAIMGALEASKVKVTQVDEVFMGNVLQAGLGQAPARQASIGAGIGNEVPCTTINKVCSSGMKAVMLAAQSIQLGQNDIVIAGGMENMSRVPHYLQGSRNGFRLGNAELTDGLVYDGLTDVYNNYHMGNAAELCAKECNISREEQDAYALESYNRSEKAWEQGLFKNEICPVEVPQRKADAVIVDTDQEYKNVKKEKIPSLRPVFQKEGTVTAANASTLNDGASALVLASEEKVKALGLTPLAEILSYADAAQAPEWFTTAPSKAIPIALKRAGLSLNDVDFFEINEAFSVVAIANNQKLGLDPAKVNPLGGAVSLGHPLGSSGSRILVTLINVLQQKNGTIGVAGICNGGGGASAVVIKKA